MTWAGRAAAAVGSVFGGWDMSAARRTQLGMARQGSTLVDPRERYAVLRAYYKSNGLYESLNRAMYEAGIWNPSMRPLRNPAYRIVEAHTAHCWPGDLPAALPLQTENDRLAPALEQIWRWSNWASNKQVFVRWLAICGDVFVKVVRPAVGDTGQAGPRVYFELIDPAHVSDFDTDERGNLTYCRIEVPRQERRGDDLVSYTHVEIWSKAEQSYRRWAIPENAAVRASDEVDQLGPPAEERPFRSMGVDFVPIAHCQFMDVGEPRGVGAYLLQLDKIDAVNQDATRLAQMLFRHGKETLVVHGAGKDAGGRPLPAPRLETRTNGASGEAGTVAQNDAMIWYVPGDAAVDSLVPALPYEHHRNQILDGLDDLERDCPEMAWARVMEMGGQEVSGRALRFKLAPFVSRVLEVRGNAEDALARLDAMAITLAQARPALPGFDVGTYQAGDLEHQFAQREVIALSDLEDAQAQQAIADASQKKLAAGWSQRQVWREAGLDDATMELIETEKSTIDVVPEVEQ